ncbi:unnamed protein product [Gongylonema pulchrum]|uniref:Peptide ABC transporter substrate-binding protein n=1 Tax=Gongylonema pulchrum TaxID=637853 RepID=A0A183D1T8_9BILA|nr:unnamed protein product [Gongylonema pulchrum]
MLLMAVLTSMLSATACYPSYNQPVTLSKRDIEHEAYWEPQNAYKYRDWLPRTDRKQLMLDLYLNGLQREMLENEVAGVPL